MVDHDIIYGVSAEELKQLKDQFGLSSFTCCVRSWPWAKNGFENSSELERHMIETHAQGFRCQAAGCQYPAFASEKKTLKAHVREKHQESSQPRANIRSRGQQKPRVPTMDIGSQRRQLSNPAIEMPQPGRRSTKRVCMYVSATLLQRCIAPVIWVCQTMVLKCLEFEDSWRVVNNSNFRFLDRPNDLFRQIYRFEI